MCNGLKCKIAGNDLKAFQIFPRPKNPNNAIIQSVIVKFIYFHHKNIAYGGRRHLKDRGKHFDSKKLWVQKRVYRCLSEKTVKSINMIAVTNNCAVSILCKSDNGRNVYVKWLTQMILEN